MFDLDSLKGWWDALTAVGTVSMAVTTVIVIRQGRRLRKDDDQHHRDTFKPICVLTPYDGVDPRHWRDTLLTVHTDAPRPGFGMVAIKCALRNIGCGPALNLRLLFRFHDMGGYTTQPWELAPLRPGELHGREDAPLEIPLQFEPRFNNTDFAMAAGKSWELILTYEDMFGSSFYSLHAKNPLQMNKLYREAGVKGYYAPPQSWVVLGEGSPPMHTGAGLGFGFAPNHHRLPERGERSKKRQLS